MPTKEIKEISDLPGVGEKTAEKLREAGFEDMMAIAVSPIAELADVGELGEATARKIINAARKVLKMGFITAEEAMDKRQDIGKITFGSDTLNKLIGGGVETQAITEAFGEYGSGKTQIGFQLAVNVQLPVEKGGLNGSAAFIDTEGTFRPQRIVDIAKASGLDSKQVLKNIHVARAYTSDHQVLLLEKVPELIESNVPIKLIVIDSLTALFRAEYLGRGTLAERQQKLNKFIHELQRMADRFNIAIYVTNQVMAQPDIFFGDPTKAVGGNIVGHSATYRLYLRRAKGGKRVARLIDSPSMPEGEAIFMLAEEGIKDSEEKK